MKDSERKSLLWAHIEMDPRIGRMNLGWTTVKHCIEDFEKEKRKLLRTNRGTSEATGKESLPQAAWLPNDGRPSVDTTHMWMGFAFRTRRIHYGDRSLPRNSLGQTQNAESTTERSRGSINVDDAIIAQCPLAEQFGEPWNSSLTQIDIEIADMAKCSKRCLVMLATHQCLIYRKDIYDLHNKASHSTSGHTNSSSSENSGCLDSAESDKNKFARCIASCKALSSKEPNRLDTIVSAIEREFALVSAVADYSQHSGPGLKPAPGMQIRRWILFESGYRIAASLRSNYRGRPRKPDKHTLWITLTRIIDGSIKYPSRISHQVIKYKKKEYNVYSHELMKRLVEDDINACHEEGATRFQDLQFSKRMLEYNIITRLRIVESPTTQFLEEKGELHIDQETAALIDRRLQKSRTAAGGDARLVYLVRTNNAITVGCRDFYELIAYDAKTGNSIFCFLPEEAIPEMRKPLVRLLPAQMVNLVQLDVENAISYLRQPHSGIMNESSESEGSVPSYRNYLVNKINYIIKHLRSSSSLTRVSASIKNSLLDNLQESIICINAPPTPAVDKPSLDNARLTCVAPEVKHPKDAVELMQCGHFLIANFFNVLSTDSKPVRFTRQNNKAAAKKL